MKTYFTIPILQLIALYVYNREMNELSPDQYELVLKYMETVNEDNFEVATLAMQQNSFSLERAIQNKFNRTNSRRAPQPDGPSDEEVIRKYVEFITKKNAEWSFISAFFRVTKTLVLTILSLLTRVLPRNVRLRYFGSDFQKLYLPKLPALFTSRSLPNLLQQTKNLSSKAVLLLISPRKSHPDITAFLSRADLQKVISRNFWLTGHCLDHPDVSKIDNRESPLVIALRYNIFEELVQIGRSTALQTLDTNSLERWAHDSRNMFKRDCNVLVKYRNFISRAYGLFYEEQEEQQVNLVDMQRNSEQIQQQNKAYQQMEQERKRMKLLQQQKAASQREEQRKLQELLAERQLRKSSIPEEPTEGNIIRISFRCPDGSTIIRNFSAEEKIDLVFQWVQLNDEIEFEDSSRNFEIMHSYPPQPLSSRKQEVLSSIFESQQQKVVIREL